MMSVPGEVEDSVLDRAAVDPHTQAAVGPHTRGAALGGHRDPTATAGLREGTGMGMALRLEDITLTTTE